jgi:Glycosyl transferase 4-like domain
MTVAAPTSPVRVASPAPSAVPTSPMNVLFVSIAFPPKSDPEALQAGRYFKYLARQPGIGVDVVTSRNPTLWMPTDETLRPYLGGVRQQIEIPIFEPRLLSVALGKLFPRYVMLPDLRQSFHWQWWRVVHALERQPDVVYCRAFPLSSVVMGRRLARHYRVPLVVHLSDPWTESAILNFSGLSLAYNRRMQARCFEEATAITLASPRMVDLYRARFPHLSGKFHLMPNVYDPDDVRPAARKPTTDKLRLVYTGSLQGGRSVRHFLRVLDWCAAKAPEELTHLSVELAGSLDSTERQLLATTPHKFVRHVGSLPLQAAQKMQREADVLLVFDTPLRPEDSVFFPSKLLDYLVTGVPIFALTSPGSMTRDIVTDRVGRCFDHEDVEAAGRHLLDLVASSNRSGAGVCGSAPMAGDDRFSAAANADRLAALLRGLR